MDEQNMTQASRKRLLLSWYIDFILFMTLWGLLSYFTNLDASVPFWAPYIVFAVIRFITGKFVGSIGYIFLSIDKGSMSVDEVILRKENWLTILLGVLMVLEGTKQLVRWTQLSVAQPAFGFFPDDLSQIIIHVTFGSLCILAGYWFLKLNTKGFYLAISVFMINIISDALSWTLWDPVAEKMVLARRELQGVPVRDGEIELMQALFPEVMLLMAGLTVIAILFTYRRFITT